MRRAFALFLLLVLLISAVPVAAKSPVQTDTAGTRSYVVRMAQDPVVAYKGGVNGYKATKPKAGEKINPYSNDVVKYVGYLDSKHDQALAQVGGTKLYDYRYSFNGFAAQLTAEQAAKLATVEGVLAVTADEMVTADTSSTPDFLGLTAPGGLWEQTGGVGDAGEGIIIGIIDSGIWPENPSFSDRIGKNGSGSKDGKIDYKQIPGWHGKCVPGEEFNASMCNQKLIGAQYFNAAWGGNAAIDAERPWEFNSVRDYNGHGTHTASTAGGNNGVVVDGIYAPFGTVSGIAPRARIAAYKALWHNMDTGSANGFTSDLVAAIDQAVADGVDVINYSISGTQTNFRDPVEIAFLFAADAGVFVAASAGNSGPNFYTVAHPSPWITTVAAGTHDRQEQATVTLGNGQSYTGSAYSGTPAVGPEPLINATAAGLAGADPNLVRQCFSGTLDPAAVTGKIVVCERGGTGPNNARVDKSLAVYQAGGVGMVQINVTAGASLNADLHSVPSVHLPSSALAPVTAYAATEGAEASISAGAVVTNAPAPYVAGFSSRGPLLASGDLIKPDLIAPGQDILAAVSPMGNNGLNFALYSGTSMSSPHVAGLAALMKDLHPDWTPMMIKSALMTTGYDVLDGPGTSPAVIFSQGAGHVQPNSAADPGLVYNSDFTDWFGFLCATQLPVSFCANAGIPVLDDPSNLNGPSIAIGALAGSQTVTREVTNVSNAPATYAASVAGLAGIDVVVNPTSLTLNPGETKSFSVTFTRVSAQLNAFHGGTLSWNDGTHNVRIPVVVVPVALSAPAQVTGNGDPLTYQVTFGYNGSFTAAPRGLVPAAVTAGEVADDPTDGACSLTAPNAQLISVTIPEDATYARFSLFDADVNPGTDLDLCVFRGTTLVGSSGSGTSAEEVNLLNPAAADYTVVVQGWGVVGKSPFKLHAWVLGDTDTGNMTVTAPASAVVGQTGDITLTFDGLSTGTKYLGSVAYSGAAGMPNPTIVRVDVP